MPPMAAEKSPGPKPNEQARGVDPSRGITVEMLETLGEMRTVVMDLQAMTDPDSVRARGLHGVLRLCEVGGWVLMAAERGEVPLRLLSRSLELRDLAKEEQRWIDSIERATQLDDGQLDVLQLYKARWAQLEVSTGMAIAYVGTDREEGDEASWWANRAGATIGDLVAMAPSLGTLPGSRRE